MFCRHSTQLENNPLCRLVELILQTSCQTLPRLQGQLWEQNLHLAPEEQPGDATWPAERFQSRRVSREYNSAKSSIVIKIDIFSHKYIDRSLIFLCKTQAQTNLFTEVKNIPPYFNSDMLPLPPARYLLTSLDPLLGALGSFAPFFLPPALAEGNHHLLQFGNVSWDFP